MIKFLFLLLQFVFSKKTPYRLKFKEDRKPWIIHYVAERGVEADVQPFDTHYSYVYDPVRRIYTFAPNTYFQNIVPPPPPPVGTWRVDPKTENIVKKAF